MHRRDYGAVYFVRAKFSFGVFVRDLSDAERQEMQTNKGVAVRLVVDATPAFDADVLVDDIITAVDGAAVVNASAFNGLMKERHGKLVTFTIVRRGQTIEKQVQLV